MNLSGQQIYTIRNTLQASNPTQSTTLHMRAAIYVEPFSFYTSHLSVENVNKVPFSHKRVYSSGPNEVLLESYKLEF